MDKELKRVLATVVMRFFERLFETIYIRVPTQSRPEIPLQTFQAQGNGEKLTPSISETGREISCVTRCSYSQDGRGTSTHSLT